MFATLLIWAGTATGQVLPSTAVVAMPCEPDSGAACWERSPTLHRFAAPDEARRSPVHADLRLAWSSEGLLLRIDELPPGITVELSAASSARQTALKQMDTIRGREDTLLLPLAGLEAGTELHFRLHLIDEGSDGSHAYGWAPSGPGRHDQSARILLAEELPPRFGVEASWEGDELHLLAPAASQIRLIHDSTAPPRSAKGPGPWTLEARDQIDVIPPHSGWHQIEARWHDTDGQLIDLQRSRIWIDGPAPSGLHAAEIHPAPLWLEMPSDRPFELHDGDRICAPPEWAAAAHLLEDELQRFTGLLIEQDTGQDCEIRLIEGSSTAAEFPSDARDMIDADEGFGLIISHRGAAVHATDLRGAVYGSLALADALGPDGESSALRAADAPSMDTRVIFWNLNTRNTPDWSLDDATQLIQRVMTRGRINLLVITPTDSLRYPSHPELSHGRALRPEELQVLINEARALGLEVVPGLNSPGHADWLLASHPELIEDVNTKLVCTRHPDLRPLLIDVMEDLLEIYGDTDWMHIGRDESHWQSDRYFGDERCPRCAGTPRAVLFADDMSWQIDWLAERSIRPMIWSDMILEGWNGRRDGVHKSLDWLTERQKSSLLVMAWSPLGDPLENLADQGIEVMRVHTGYLDWKRADLEAQQSRLAGEGLGLWTSVPWQATGPSTGSRPLHYFWSSIILAGTTAWRPELSAHPIDRSLARLVDLPGFRPGLHTIPHGRSAPLRIEGTPPEDALLELAWDGRLEIEGIRFGKTRTRVATEDSHITLPVGRALAGLSLLQATAPTHGATQVLLREQRKAKGGRATAEVIFHYSDGSQETTELHYGRHTYRPDGDLRSRSLWHTAGPLVIAETVEGMERPLTDRHLYRLDIASPKPSLPIERVEIMTSHTGVQLILAAAASLEHP